MPITKNLLQSDRANKEVVTERTESAVVPGIFACGTCSIELHTTYSTDVIFRHVPSPGSYRVPFLDGDFHVGFAEPDFVSRTLAASPA